MSFVWAGRNEMLDKHRQEEGLVINSQFAIELKARNA